MSVGEIKTTISCEICDIDEQLKEKILNFSDALKELPHELFVETKIIIDGKDSGRDNLKIDLGKLFIEQVENHFNKNN